MKESKTFNSLAFGVKHLEATGRTILPNGQVLGSNGLPLKLGTSSSGYKYIHFRINNKVSNYFIHRLVAYLYLPNPNNYNYVNHKDCNKQNNDVSNLEWCDALSNSRHAVANKRFKDRRGERASLASMTDEKAKEVKAAISSGISTKEIMKQFSLTEWSVLNMKYGRTWKHI